MQQAFDDARALIQRVIGEIEKRVVGQTETVDGAVAGLVLGGHILLEGVPGVGKTLLARTLADAVALSFSRIQFTPDLMPADIVGTHVVRVENGEPKLVVQRGPVFTHLLLADEINRASPKTQAALLEAMQERQVSLAGQTEALPHPFFVIATQNPLDNEGTYPLPEAQLDRFMMKLSVRFPSPDEVLRIALSTQHGEEKPVAKAGDAAALLRAGQVIRTIAVAEEIAAFVVQLVFATHPNDTRATPLVRRCVRAGVSPRAAQALLVAAKYQALCDGRYHVAKDDVRKVALSCLRHRLVLSYTASSEGISSDDILAEVLRAHA